MIDKKRYDLLKNKLDSEKIRLESVTIPTGLPHSVGTLIHRDMDVSSIEEEKLLLIHAMLHMFYYRGGKGLSKSDIVMLHSKVAKRLTNHIKHDELDKNGLY